jgi:hypothetical protein
MGRLLTGLLAPSETALVGGHEKSTLVRGTTELNPRKNATSHNALDPSLKSEELQLSEGIHYKGTGRNIFRTGIPPLRILPGPGPRLLPPVPPTKPSLTVRLRFFGFSSSPADGKRIFLSNDGDAFIAREGEIVNRRYQILKIKQTSVEVEDLIDGVRLTLWLGQG